MSLPHAPQLPAEALREVFLYPDPNRPADPRNQFSDASRLAFFGQKMAETVYLCIAGDRMRGKDAAQIQAYFNHTFLRFAERTAQTYQWAHNIRYPQNVNGNAPQESRRLFFTYVGAVSVQYPDAFSRLQGWMIALLEFYGAD
ncbi:hypothetical protein GY45DRAFT_1365187 [Cubamyces sp. BRFM 1775]|nr:hypothetical protein GY45DRAFT_1365187 [Cubamyces sp. BRFM 1775]